MMITDKDKKAGIAIGTRDNKLFIQFSNESIVWFEPLDALTVAEAMLKHIRQLLLQPKRIIEIPKSQVKVN